MKTFVLIGLLIIGLLACQSTNDSTGISNSGKPIAIDTTSIDSIKLIQDTDFVDTISLCLPYPNDSFFLVRNDYKFLESYYHECIYYYLVSQIDSLESKQILKMDEFWGAINWTQKFNAGISFEYLSYPEKGGGGKLYTKCKNKTEFLKTIEPLIKYEIIDSTYYDPNMIWKNDSTLYEPMEQDAGCYYEIKKDSVENYILEWYCGC